MTRENGKMFLKSLPMTGVGDGPDVAVGSRSNTPRRSFGSGPRTTSPFAASRSIRLVMVPEVTSVARSSAPG